MKSNLVDVEKQRSSVKFSPCSLKTGKKYILGLVATKALVIWFIYTKSNDLWPLAHFTPLIKPKTVNLTLYNVSLFHIPLTDQKDMLPFYIEVAPEIWCFLSGLNLKESRSQKLCKCLIHWYGLDCGIPEAVWNSSYLQQGHKQGVEIRRRKIPRRIICSILFFGEFSLLDIVVRDAFHAVDVFLVAEEYTEEPSPLLLALKSGYLAEFQSKIMPLPIRNASKIFKNVKDWNSLMFSSLWKEGWEHLADFRPDDIFLLLHISSIISKDVLLFLKLYDGFPEPFHFILRPLLYQFPQNVANSSLVLQKLMLFSPFGCSFQYFHSICNSDIIKLLNNACITDKNMQSNFEKNFWKLETWVIGTPDSPSGWQCNWCTKIHEMQDTFKKHKWLLKYLNISESVLDHNSSIGDFVKEGKWLDGSHISFNLISRDNKYFAPECVINDFYKYSFLINNTPS